MSTTAKMITSSAQSDASLSGARAAAIDQLLASAAFCAICLEACRREDDPWSQVDFRTIDADSDDVCMATAQVLGRSSQGTQRVCATAVVDLHRGVRACGDDATDTWSTARSVGHVRERARAAARSAQLLSGVITRLETGVVAADR